MDRTTILWALVALFGSSIAFRAVRQATEGAGTGLVVAAQVATLAAVIGLIVLVARRRG